MPGVRGLPKEDATARNQKKRVGHHSIQNCAVRRKQPALLSMPLPDERTNDSTKKTSRIKRQRGPGRPVLAPLKETRRAFSSIPLGAGMESNHWASTGGGKANDGRFESKNMFFRKNRWGLVGHIDLLRTLRGRIVRSR